MKQLLYLVMSLVVIAAIIPAASAINILRYDDSAKPDLWLEANKEYTITDPWTEVAADAYCVGKGWPLGAVHTQTLISTTGYVYPNGSALGITGTTTYCSGYGSCSQSFNTSTKKFARVQVLCDMPGEDQEIWYYPVWQINKYNLTSQNVNFTGTPTAGSYPLLVNFSIGNYSEVNLTNPVLWEFGDGYVEEDTDDVISYEYGTKGSYTVSLTFTNATGLETTITKSDYITVYDFAGIKTKWFQSIDGTNGNIVLNSSIQLNDVENSSWVNATGLINDGMSSITTPSSHHINAYAQALGYSDADDLNILNDGQPEYIMMWPTFAKNVSAGNVSVYVTVKDKDTKANIVGAGVTASLASGSMSTTTNEAGIAYFIVKNSSMVLITAQAIGQGYQTATTTINTGTASGGSASAAATILLGKNTVTPTFTTSVTTLPAGGTPTPTVTILPGCEDTISAAGQEKCRAAQSNQGLSFISANLLGLIQICFLVTVLYLLGIKLGK